MKFALINHKDGNKEMVGYIESPEKFADAMKNKYSAIELENKTVEDLTSNSTKDNIYILSDKNGATVVKKYTEILEGYFYNYNQPKTEILCSYEFIPCKINEEPFKITTKDKPKDKVYCLHKLDFTSLPEYPCLNIIGRRHSGKTWLVSDLLENFKNKGVTNILIIQKPTDKMNPFYKKRFPDARIEYEYSSELIKEFLDNQTNNSVPGIVILDDALSTRPKIWKDANLWELIFNGSSYKTTVITTFQFPLSVSPKIRSSFDGVFLFEDNFAPNQKRYYEHYAVMFPDFTTFRKTLLNQTKDYRAMFIKNRVNSQNLLDKVFWY